MSQMVQDLHAAIQALVARYPSDVNLWPDDMIKLLSAAHYLLRLLEKSDDAE